MDQEKKEEIAQEKVGTMRHIVVNLSSTEKKIINVASKEFHSFLTEVCDNVELPEIVPMSEACFTSRKSPCGNGTATFSRIKLRVYQRKFTVAVYDDGFEKIAEFLKNSPARAELMVLF
ncbi:hypothetical protein NUSPORA_01536 [Nucleospora cyclopteri]